MDYNKFLASKIKNHIKSGFTISEVYQAVKQDRYGMGIELKESYFELMKKNLESLLREKLQEKLF